jgi:diacylglycerol kinase family enzyme
MVDVTDRVPAIVNEKSGTAKDALAALQSSALFEIHAVKPTAIAETARKLVAAGARRILVAGGDGTVASVAAVLVGTPTELAVLPGGTLNHFARDLGIPTVAAEALAIATGSSVRGVDVGMVNGHIFLNTSSVGAYVGFVRLREQLEPRFGYKLASGIAAFRILFQLRRMVVELEVDGEKRLFRTPVVFIGVGQRELKLPVLGNRVRGGERGLHVMVVQSRTSARLLAIGLAAVARGLDRVSHTPELESVLVDKCRIQIRNRGRVAVDGELLTLATPLDYELRREELRVVCPPAVTRADTGEMMDRIAGVAAPT